MRFVQYFPCGLDIKLPLTQVLQLTYSVKLCLLLHVGIENEKSIEILKSYMFVLHLINAMYLMHAINTCNLLNAIKTYTILILQQINNRKELEAAVKNIQ